MMKDKDLSIIVLEYALNALETHGYTKDEASKACVDCISPDRPGAEWMCWYQCEGDGRKVKQASTGATEREALLGLIWRIGWWCGFSEGRDALKG